jgi:FkbM family methyltransferase
LVPQARFICFEANRDNYEAILRDPLVDRKRFRVEYLAVTDRNGPVRFNVYRSPDDPENRGLSSLKIRRQLEPARVDVVPGVTLDSYITSTCPDERDLVLWIDVEGAALDVLQGAMQSLSRTNLVFVEVEEAEIYYEESHSRREVSELLGAQGFRELLYRPYKGIMFGDALFVSNSLYDRMGLGRAVLWFALWFPFAAGWQASKQMAFRQLSRLPMLLRLWRLIKRGPGLPRREP